MYERLKIFNTASVSWEQAVTKIQGLWKNSPRSRAASSAMSRVRFDFTGLSLRAATHCSKRCKVSLALGYAYSFAAECG
jgi:hypothetical protein